MSAMDRRRFVHAGAAAMALAAVGAGPAPEARAAGTVKVGASLPFTGWDFFVEDGLRQLLGYRLWRDEVNAAGGLLGRKVELVLYDDGGKPEGGARAYRRLIEADGVELLLGNYSSGVASATIPVVEEAKLPCVFPMAWQPKLWLAEHRWTVPTLPLASEVTRPLVAYLSEQDAKRVAVVSADNGYARDLSDGLLAWLREFGISVTTHQVYGSADGPSLEEAVAGALATEPDVLAGGNVGDQIPELVGAVHAAEAEAGGYAWFEMDEPVLLEHRDALEGMVGFGLWLPHMPYPGNRAFVEAFTDRWEREYPDEPIGLLLDHHAAAGYGAARLLEAAVKAAGSFEPKSVRDALFGLETTTPFGGYRLDERGVQVGKTVPVVGYRHGLREVVWPPELATV